MVFIYSHYVNNTVTMLTMTTVGLREQHVKHYCVIHFHISIISYLKVKNDPRSEFSNLSNWKEEA